MNWTNLRAKIGMLVTIILMILIIAAFAAHKGCNVPIISNLLNTP